MGTPAHFLPLLHARLTYLNDTFTFALENYNGISLANRTKRGLIDGIGQLSRTLFGNAMKEEGEFRGKFYQLISFPSAQNKLTHLNSQNIDRLEVANPRHSFSYQYFEVFPEYYAKKP